MKNIILNNGVEMPQHGYGTYMIPEEKLSWAIGKAYEMGYRMFDTAWRYYNENAIAKALRANGINRRDVFITSKFNADSVCKFGYHTAKLSFLNNIKKESIHNAIEASLNNLETDYIDLYLIHWPYTFWKEIWEEMEKFLKEGRIRAIGVCSFLPPHLEAIKSISDVVPAVNQFEISPLNTQKDLIKYCQDRGIAVEAMSTFSHFRSVEPRMELINNEQLKRLAVKYEKSVVQIVFKWLLQQRIIIIPKTWEEKHMNENISLYDFTLEPEDMTIIDNMDGGKFLNYNPYTCVKGFQKFFKQWNGFKSK